MPDSLSLVMALSGGLAALAGICELAGVQGQLVGLVQHSLRDRQCERREAAELVDEAVDRRVELVRGNDLADEAERERLVRGDSTPAHDRVLRPPEADQACQPLRAAAAGDHPEPHLRERELDVVGGEPEVAGERQLEPDAEGVAAQLCDHGLGTALGRGDVPGEARERLGLGLEEPGDVPARAEGAARTREDDEADAFVLSELVERASELVARLHRDAIQLPGYIERDRRDAALVVPLDAEAVVAHAVLTGWSSRSRRRRTFPEGLFGSSSTNRYSRGRLKRASASEARHQASSSSAGTSRSATTNATTR